MSKHCCKMMNSNVKHICEHHTDPFDCPDHLLYYNDVFDEYSIIIHDGGRSGVVIAFCPWCGGRLPDSKRDRWFSELEALGIEDPVVSEIPSQYRSDRWYREA